MTLSHRFGARAAGRYFLFAALALTTSCRTTASKQSETLSDESNVPQLCVGVRGNGDHIMAHFGAYARIVEHYGLFDGASGGSSGSISLFLYESILANKALRQCKTGACNKEEEGLRAGLLLKSIQGYLAHIASKTDEVIIFRGLIPIYNKAKEQGMDRLLREDVVAARGLLVKLLESPDVSDIINKEVLHLLKNSPDPGYHTKALYEGMRNMTAWRTDDPIILVRPGVIDFSGLARKIARIANFYAGYGPADEPAMKEFLDTCALPESRGKNWDEIAGATQTPTACGQMYSSLLQNYRQRFINEERSFHSRLDDPIGTYLPTLISTSILEGHQAATRFEHARRNFLAGKPIEWQSDFNDVRFGYWGRTEDLARVEANTKRFSDLKTAKFIALGHQTWKEALHYSPAEPGLARAQEMSSTRISAGGWSDLHPVLGLQNLGCRSVVYVTRRGEEESTFARGVAKLLGMQADQDARLYQLKPANDGSESSYRQSIRQADGVWCTNWDHFPTEDFAGTINDAYNAPFETRTNAPTALVSYPHASAQLGHPGCSL